MLKDDVYQAMLDNDEMWYVYDNGYACIIYDLPMYDA